jgi:4-hydroxyphenylacetaldehyde oxime monooxygenase
MAAVSCCLLPHQQWQLTITTLLVVLLFLLVAMARRRRRTSGGSRLPPGPPRLPILGNLHQMGPLPHRSLRDLARRHGPVMLLRLGAVPTLVVSSPAAAREVMKAHDVDCCSRPDTPGPRRLSYGHKDVARCVSCSSSSCSAHAASRPHGTPGRPRYIHMHHVPRWLALSTLLQT